MTDPSVTAGRDYPVMAAEAGRIEPVPRRIGATLGGGTVFDSVRARYVVPPKSWRSYAASRVSAAFS
jgi:hypothetical protein